MGQYSLSGEVLLCCLCFQVSLITLASHGLVNIPADEVQEKVDKTVGVSDILPICVAITVHTFVQRTAIQVVCVCTRVSLDIPHPARVHWREVARHDQLHCKTPGGNIFMG